MKKFTHIFLGLLLLGSVSAQAQQLQAARIDRSKVTRCGTEDVISRKLQDPAYRAARSARLLQAVPAPERTSTLTGPVTIPLVVHVVAPDPYIVTEAQVDALISRLNLDFSGLNADSANAGTAFMSRRGHSKIRFARAKRTPTGGFTTGVERRAGAMDISTNTYQPIKHSTDGGLDPWDVTKYYNIWVGQSQTLLGIAPTIGQGNATETPTSDIGIDGVCINIVSFSNGCFSDPSYNMGRTVAHEIGHNFGLYHTFHYTTPQDVPSCSTGNDYGQPENGTLPASLTGAAYDDTPNQSIPTSTCPTGIVASNCNVAPNPPGKMYQNYMDYTDDGCYSMFTTHQVARMEYNLEFYRPGYLTSDGALAPVGTPNVDVAPALFINPSGAAFDNSACSLLYYPTPVCPGLFTPRVQIVNRGNNTLNSVTVSVQVNSSTAQTATFNNLNLTYGNTTILTLPQVTLGSGTNVIKVTTSNPNGGADGVPANDVISTTLNFGPATSPLTENFEGTFPSANFNISNVNGDSTWRKANVGAGGSTGSAVMNNYDNLNIGSTDELQLVPMTLTPGADSLVVSFDMAYAQFVSPQDGSVTSDTLRVLASFNCGANYTELKKLSGNELATATNTSNSFVPTASQWVRRRYAVPVISGTQAEVVFQNLSDFDNKLYLDNINVSSTCRGTVITAQPAAMQAVCANSPVTFSVTATGNALLTYQWYKGANAIPNATSATYTISSATAGDADSYYVVVKNACNVTVRSNDALLTVNTGGACGGTAVSNVNADVQSIVLMPNAVRNSAKLRVTVARSTKIEWKVIDAAGRIVKRFTQQAPAGESTINFDGNGLATGAYQLVGDTNKGKTTTLKFVRL